jgi:hypothetical protein
MVKWAGHAACMGEASNHFIGKPESKKDVWRRRCTS